MNILPLNRNTSAVSTCPSSPTAGASFQTVLATKTAAVANPDSAADSLEAYVKMSPAQRMRANALSELGLTEDDIKKMTPTQQKAVEARIADLIKQQMQQSAQKAKQSQTPQV